MERSMVQELHELQTNFSQSQIFGGRSSFININGNDFDELRKSRIQNLPDYRKQDLSQKLNFVVIFQGIEIERLSVEIQTLRIKLKDGQRQLFNYRNYEVQIRQLTQRCHSLENQCQKYQQSSEQMTLICQKLYDELELYKARYADIDPSLKEKYKFEKQKNNDLINQLEKWKSRLRALEISKSRELQDMKLMMQSQRKSMISRQIHEITIKYQGDREILEKEIKKLRELLSCRDSDMNNIRYNMQQLEVKVSEMDSMRYQLTQYENKFALLSQENIRLNDLLRKKQDQIDRFKNNENNLNSQIQNLNSMRNDYNQIKTTVEHSSRQLKQWPIRFAKLEEENRNNMILGQKAKEYQRLLDQSGSELQRLNQIIRDKIHQNQKINAKIVQMGLQLEQSTVVQNKLMIYERKIDQLMNDNDRINGILKSKLADTESWKQKYQDLQPKLRVLGNIENDKRNLQDKISQYVRQNEQYRSQVMSMQKQLHYMQQLKNKLQKQQQQRQEYINEIDRLNNLVRNAKNNQQILQKTCQQLQNKLSGFSNIERELNELKKTNAYLTQQIDRINGVICQKLVQIAKLKQNYSKMQSHSNHYKQIETRLIDNLKQIETLIMQIDCQKKKNNQLQDSIETITNKLNRAQNDIFAVNQQKQSLISSINQKGRELEQNAAEIVKYQNEMKNYRKVQTMCHDLQSKMQKIEQNMKQFERRYISQKERSSNLNNQLQKATQEYNKLKKQGTLSPKFIEQFANIKTEITNKDYAITNLNKRIQNMQKLIQLMKQSLLKQESMIKFNHDKWISTARTLNELDNFMNKMGQMINQISKLNQEKLKLQGQTKILNFELSESRVRGSNDRFDGGKSSINFNENIRIKHPQNQSTTFGGGSNFYQRESSNNYQTKYLNPKDIATTRATTEGETKYYTKTVKASNSSNNLHYNPYPTENKNYQSNFRREF